MPDALLLPAHGPVTASVHVRIEQLQRHHDERLSEVWRHVRSGSTTAYEIAHRLRWTSRGRHLDELAVDHQMTAVLEVEAHLELLNLIGRVGLDEQRETRRFVPAAE